MYNDQNSQRVMNLKSSSGKIDAEIMKRIFKVNTARSLPSFLDYREVDKKSRCKCIESP